MHASTYNLGIFALMFTMLIHSAISAQGLSTPTTPPDLSAPAPTPKFIPQDGPWEWVKESDEKYWIWSCDFASPTYGWGVGGENSSYMWDGEKWRIMEYDSQTLGGPHQVVVSDPETIWAFEGWPPESFKWEGHWVAYDIPLKGDFVEASFLNKDLGYIIGGQNETPDDEASRSILKWNGLEWQEVPFPLSPVGVTPLSAVKTLAEDDVWVSDDYQLYHWDGNTWKIYPANVVTGSDEVAINEFESIGNQLWAAGSIYNDIDHVTSGTILYWDGKEWRVQFESEYQMSQLRMISPTLGWAMGRIYVKDETQHWVKQYMLFYWDGNTWSEYLQMNQDEYGSICGFDAEHLWIFQGYGDYAATWKGVLRLRRKATATATATSTTPAATLTPVPSQTLTPLPTETPTPIPESIIGDFPAGGVWVGVGVIFVVLAVGIVLRQRRNR